jgi:hypothetical protein
MPDQTDKDPQQPKRRQPWGPYLAPAILIAAFGVFVGLRGGLSDPDAEMWEEHFRLGRAAMTVMPVMVALLGGGDGLAREAP